MSQANAGFRPPEPLDDLAGPLRDLDSALLRDGETLREQIPPAGNVAARALALIDALEPGQLDAAMRSERAASERAMRLEPKPATRTRGRGMLAIAAMAAVVLLVALVLRAGLTRTVVTPHPTLTPSSTAGPTFAPPSGQWKSVPGLTGTTDPAFSPLDPRLVYQAMYDTNPPYARRSDDGGATWQTLPIPAIAGLAPTGLPGVALRVIPSPLDANTVFLVISFPGEPTNCSAPEVAHSSGGFKSRTTRTSGTPFCDFSYISQDRGAQWQHVTLPGGGMGYLGGDSGLHPIHGEHSIIAQGTRLYSYDAVENAPPNYGYFVASDDHGLTWHAIDAAISAQGQSIVDYDAPPDGSTIFAVGSYGSGNAFSLWRSDDAGAHWLHWPLFSNGTFTSFGGLAVVARSAGGEPLLYLVGHVGEGTGNPASTSDFYVSRDGGLHWSSAPSGGMTNHVNDGTLMPSILGVLGDGSIIVQTPEASGSGPVNLQFFAWREGQPSWRMLAPPALGGYLFAVTQVGGDVLWVGTVHTTQNVAGYEIQVQAYTVP